MEGRMAGDHKKPSARYATGDVRYESRSVRPPYPTQRPAVATAPASIGPPSTIAAAASDIQRPRVRMRRVPVGALRYEPQAMYSMEETPLAAAAELELDDDFQLDDELKLEYDRSVRAHRRPQRIKYVKCKTRVLPDLLVPYLYAGDRRSRMNAIMDRTGCTIDFCPESPDADMDMVHPQHSGNHYLMCFLVAAETSAQLESATRLLRVLVDRVQAHVEYKLGPGSMRRNSEVDLTHHQENRSGGPTQRFSRNRRADDDYSQSHTINAELLKAESAEQAKSTGVDYSEERMGTTASQVGSPDGAPLLQERDVRWIEDTGVLGAPSWHEQAHMISGQARSRQSGARYHRPVYRQVLVDEAGYEVYDHLSFGRQDRYSPRVSGHASSPPFRRRRTHEPIYHHGSSSEEDNHVRRGVAVSARPSRLISLRDDNLAFRAPMRGDMSEHATRRGIKRRHEAYETEDTHPRYRTYRRGLGPLDYMSDDLDADIFLSGDELVDEVYSEASSTHQRYLHPRVVLDPPGHQRIRDNDGNKITHEEVGDGSLEDRVNRDRMTGMTQRENQSDTPHATNEHRRLLDEESTFSENKAGDSSREATQSEGVVASNVSTAFSAPAVDSGTLPSDTESVAVVPVAPSTVTHLDRVDAVKMTNDLHEGTRDGESCTPPGSVASLAPVSATVSIQLIGSEVDDTKRNQPSEAEDTVSEKNCASDPVHLTSSATPILTQLTSSTSALSTSVRARLNNALVNCLGFDSLADSQQSRVRSRMRLAAKNLALLIDQVRSHEELQHLAHAAHRLQVEILRLPSVSLEEKQKLSSTLDSAIKNASESSTSTAARVSALHSAFQEMLSSDIFRADEVGSPAVHPPPVDHNEVPAMKNREDEDLQPVQTPPTVDVCVDVQLKENHGATKSSNLASADEIRTDNHRLSPMSHVPRLNIPPEAPTFVSCLVTEMERTTGLSAVMSSAQKRLLREISKSDPYYYLHPMALLEPTRKGRGSTCPFGCAGLSAHKWERKVVSQISSRMKWFDSVAYSLAKVSGGKELLSRKKMNSTIRKLHLVALQLHCLIAHLYCIRKRVICREIDSLPTALNNSYYEKRMNGYKSRLKLTLHQQLPPTSAGISLPADELVRDTFEFYPELLLSVDIWGYNCRHDETPASKLPIDLLRCAARQSFDFETDTNGLLQGICEELLAILCMWNDFKWGESLESLNTDDIVEFEAKVKTSIRKILEAHASHLLSQWSSQISSTPAILNYIRLTQSNVYYSEQPTSVGVVSGSFPANQRNMLFALVDEDDEERNEGEKEEEDSVLQGFWRDRFTPSTSSSDADASDSAKPEKLTPLNLAPLREEHVMAVVRTKSEPVLSWSEVYDLRQKCHLLAGQADGLLAGDVNPESDPQDTIVPDVRSLLSRLTKARSIVEDAVRTSERLALHSVHHQLDDADSDRSHQDALIGSLADVESMSEECRDEDDGIVDSLLAGKDVQTEKRHENVAEGEDEDESAWKQPVLKDLVEIVTSTNQEMSEICGQRARSARVRDKLQSQSLELARQSIQIFQTILNMKP